MLRGVVWAMVLAVVAATPVWSQAVPVRVQLGGRMQFQWNTTSVARDETGSTAALPSSTFEYRRVRLNAQVQVGDWIRGRLEPDFAMGRVGLRNAWLAFELDSALVIRAGQFKKPFGLVMLTSSEVVPVIERGVRIRGLENALVTGDAGGVITTVRGAALPGEQWQIAEVMRYHGYDMGVAVEGRKGRFGWAGGVFNGQGGDAAAEDGAPSAAARLTVDGAPGVPLRLGAAWSRRTLNWPLPQSQETRTGNAFGVDLELGGFRRGLWLLADVTVGENLATQEQFAGAQVVGAWFVPAGGGRVEGLEPVARFSWGDPDRTIAGDEGVLLTPGVNVYFFGRNRLMFNWDVYLPRGDRFDAQHAARAQVNLQF